MCVLDKIAVPFLALYKFLFGKTALGYVACRDKLTRPPVKLQIVRGDFDIDQRTVLFLMLPNHLRAPAGLRISELVEKSGHMFRRANIRDRHREKFFPAIAVLLDGRVVNLAKTKRLDVVDPDRLGYCSKQ